jgi:hypothetical protein
LIFFFFRIDDWFCIKLNCYKCCYGTRMTIDVKGIEL